MYHMLEVVTADTGRLKDRKCLIFYWNYYTMYISRVMHSRGLFGNAFQFPCLRIVSQ